MLFFAGAEPAAGLLSQSAWAGRLSQALSASLCAVHSASAASESAVVGTAVLQHAVVVAGAGEDDAVMVEAAAAAAEDAALLPHHRDVTAPAQPSAACVRGDVSDVCMSGLNESMVG